MKEGKIMYLLAVCSVLMIAHPMAAEAAAFGDYKQTETAIVENRGGTSASQMMALSDEQFYDTGLEGVIMQGNGMLSYDVEHIGSGAGTMKVSGYATGNYEVVVRIVKSGVVGEAFYQISLDGGESFIGQDVVADFCKIGDAGIDLYFETEKDTVEFIEGDEYHVSIPESFAVIASKLGAANLMIVGHPMEEHDLVITILSSGGPGKSRFTVSSTKGSEIQVTDVMPENGVYRLDNDLTLLFSDSESYEKGLTFTASIVSNDDTIDYTPLYLLIAIAACGGAAGVSVLRSKKEKDSEYRIQRYQWRREEKEYEE